MISPYDLITWVGSLFNNVVCNVVVVIVGVCGAEEVVGACCGW